MTYLERIMKADDFTADMKAGLGHETEIGQRKWCHDIRRGPILYKENKS